MKSIFWVLLFTTIGLMTACLKPREQKDDTKDGLTPAINDNTPPVIAVSKPRLINEADPAIKDIWPTLCTKYNSGDSFEINASLSDDRELEKVWFEIRQVMALSQDQNPFSRTYTEYISGAIRPFNLKIKIPQLSDGGLYQLEMYLQDKAGNLATPYFTKFIVRNVVDDILPDIRVTSPDTLNINNNVVSIGGAGSLNIAGTITDPSTVKYYDSYVRNKNTKALVSWVTVPGVDQIYTGSYAITNTWTPPTGTAVGAHQLILRGVDLYNNIDSLIVDFVVVP
jgi:hypothetical protein